MDRDGRFFISSDTLYRSAYTAYMYTTSSLMLVTNLSSLLAYSLKDLWNDCKR